MGRLQDKVAIVSGAAGGMGRATAELFAREGAIVVAGDIQGPLPGESHPNVHFVTLDVADEKSWETVVAQAVADHGKLDILVNNAGVIAYEPILETSLETWNRLLAVDQTGVFLGMRAALPALIANGGGAIVNFSSIWGTRAVAGAHVYHAAKGAIGNMTRNVAITHAPDGVRANSVHPGYILTPLTAVQDDDTNAFMISHTPMGRPGQPIEVANAVLFLASDEASYITGVELDIDGGFLAQ
jgi:NAD(P)-dependent dehydrogenase (short-subunit alcohol dehydrogenase family)